MRHSMAAWIPGSGEGRSPSPFRFAVRSGCLRQRLARTAYTNILTLPNDLSPSWLIARERTSAPPFMHSQDLPRTTYNQAAAGTNVTASATCNRNREDAPRPRKHI